jgi:NAD(P)H-hydrate epimerase
MIEVDRAMIEDYGIELIQMMENAGRALATLARDQFLGEGRKGKRVTVLAGSGGNGGGAMVAARRLATWGFDVHVSLTRDPNTFSGVPAQQLAILQAMGVKLQTSIPETSNSDVVLDGIIGYSLSGAPKGRAADLIRWANAQSAPVVSLDAPSGVDATNATAYDPSIRATATLTLALPKAGLNHPQVGSLYLADISVPPELYARFLGLTVGPIFSDGDILKLN